MQDMLNTFAADRVIVFVHKAIRTLLLISPAVTGNHSDTMEDTEDGA